MKLTGRFRLLTIILILLLFNIRTSSQQTADSILKIHYLGHSSFVLQFDNGVTVVTDYRHKNAWVDYGWDSPINDLGDLVPDIMTFSHIHDDHYDPDRIPEGVQHILTGMDSLTIRGLEIKPVRTREDSVGIESNMSYIFTYKGLKICHLSDAQAEIMNINDEEVRKHITSIFPDTFDIMLMTIEWKQKFIPQAEAFVDLLKPGEVIPMHYWSDEYKNEFLDYLKLQNESGKKYQIEVNENPAYEFTDFDNSDSIKVVTLTRAHFNR